MLHIIIAVFALIFLLAIFEVSVAIGRYYGRKYVANNPEHKIEVIGVAESAVFGLLALLIAFTFSGAYERFENRKMHLLEEAHAYEQAYEYVDVFPQKYQPILRQDIKDYLSTYINAYQNTHSSATLAFDAEKAEKIKERIWATALLASREVPNQAIAASAVLAINDMFAYANTGINLSKIHPPIVIFVLLITLAALGAFLAGYTGAEAQRRPIHTLCYVLLTAFTIYIVINLEYPRAGFIGLEYFDQNLVTIRDNMHP